MLQLLCSGQARAWPLRPAQPLGEQGGGQHPNSNQRDHSAEQQGDHGATADLCRRCRARHAG